MEGKERLNVETSEGLNVEKQKRTEPCRKKKGGGDGMRPFPAGSGSIGVPFEAWSKMRVERLLGVLNGFDT